MPVDRDLVTSSNSASKELRCRRHGCGHALDHTRVRTLALCVGLGDLHVVSSSHIQVVKYVQVVGEGVAIVGGKSNEFSCVKAVLRLILN